MAGTAEAQTNRPGVNNDRVNNDRANNFDALRLIAALSVIFSHSFLIAEGSQSREPFVRLSLHQCPLGLVGVFVFFIISGYLVTESWCRQPSPGRFALKRIFRIWPGIVLNALVCGLLLGPAVTHVPLSAYFADRGLTQFLTDMLTLREGQLVLPGVWFSEDNPVALNVNGSFWTLRYEVMMYAMILILAMCRLLRAWVCIALVGVGIAAVLFEKSLGPLGEIGEWAWLLGFFASGMAVYFLRDRIAWRGRYALLAVAGLALFVLSGHFIALFPLAGAYLTIWFARRYDPWLDYARYAGDLSYGLYIYGWPAEQFVMWLSGGHATWWQVCLGSLAVAVPLAWISWHLVEAPALRWVRTGRPLGIGRGRLQPAGAGDT